jgi:hypothetical protein
MTHTRFTLKYLAQFHRLALKHKVMAFIWGGVGLHRHSLSTYHVAEELDLLPIEVALRHHTEELLLS